MANIYNDSSRKDVFAGRARSLAPPSGPEMCQIDLLEWFPGIGPHPYLEPWFCNNTLRSWCLRGS